MPEDRLNRVREYVNNIFDGMENADERRAAYIHSYGVSQCCALLAVKRGLDLELGAVIGLLHDVYAYKTGIVAWHAQNGAEMVRVVFKHGLSDLFSGEEQTIIKSAIYHHANKDIVHDEYDELLKDSDVLQRLSFDTTWWWDYAQRLFGIMKEFSLPAPNITVIPKESASVNHLDRSYNGI
jgi:HD superfamily phosphohydrolase YqeK